jgi:hypothetical protein
MLKGFTQFSVQMMEEVQFPGSSEDENVQFACCSVQEMDRVRCPVLQFRWWGGFSS